MQKIATKVFIYSSIIFGLIGILMILTLPVEGGQSSDFNAILPRLLFTMVFIILPAFALSIAGKFLSK